MSVYGDMLAFFPEQVRRFSYFSMIPNTVSGYQERTEIVEVKGVLQHLRKSQLGEDVSTLTEHIVPTFWTKQKLDVGKFLHISEDEDYRIEKNYDNYFTGKYHCYELSLVTGVTDKQGTEELDYGVGDFS